MKYVRFLLILAALLLIAVPVFAQEELGLSADDAALYQAAVENSATAGSFSYSVDTLISITGVGEDGDVVIDVNASGVIGEDVFSMLVSGALSAGGEDIPADLDIRFVDNTGYVGLMGQFYSITPEDLGDMMSMAGGMLPVDPEAMMEGDMGAMGDMSGMMSGMMDMDPSEFVSFARLDDMDGQAHFQINLDYGAMFNNPDMAEMMQSIMQAQMGMMGDMGSAAMTPEQMQAMMEAMGPMFENAVFVFDQYVDLESQTVSRAVLTVEFPFGYMNPETPEGNMSISMDINLSGYGEAVSVEAPADAQPLMQLFGALMGGMPSM